VNSLPANPMPTGSIAKSLVVTEPKVTKADIRLLLPKPKPKVQSPTRGPSAPTGDIWDCIAAKESGNRPLGCAPHCGRLQWLASTWRAAGGTKYASLPQQATYAQEVAIARSWLAKTSWNQWPNTSRACGVR
jgi:hypothetical protein